jgi:hypothetical protein
MINIRVRKNMWFQSWTNEFNILLRKESASTPPLICIFLLEPYLTRLKVNMIRIIIILIKSLGSINNTDIIIEYK